MSRGLLYDSTLCIGCLECESGCAAANGLPYDETIAAEKKASEHKFTYLKSVQAADGAAGERQPFPVAPEGARPGGNLVPVRKLPAGIVHRLEWAEAMWTDVRRRCIVRRAA